MPTRFQGRPIDEIEGIGPARKTALAGLGLNTIEDLLALPAAATGRLLAGLPGIGAELVLGSFVPQARLLRLDGMTGQFAEGLVASGYRTYNDLVLDSSTGIRAALAQRQSEGLIPDVPDEALIVQWQLEAARKSQGGSLHIRVFDRASKAPLAGAVVRLNGTGKSDDTGRLRRETDENGLVFLDELGEGVHRVAVSADQHQSWLGTFAARPGSHARLLATLAPGADQPILQLDEFAGDVIVAPSATDAIVFDTLGSIDEFPQAPPFQIVSFSAATDTVLLASLWKRKINDQITIYQLRQPRALLPAGAKKGDVVLRNADGSYRLVDGLTPGAFRQELVRRRFSAAAGG